MNNVKLLRPLLVTLAIAIAALLGSYLILPIWTEKSGVDESASDIETLISIQNIKLQKLIKDSENIAELQAEFDNLIRAFPVGDHFENFLTEVDDAIGSTGKLIEFTTTNDDGSSLNITLDQMATPRGFTMAISTESPAEAVKVLEKLETVSRAYLVERVSINNSSNSGQTRLVIDGVIFSTPEN